MPRPPAARSALRYEGTDLRTLTALTAAGHGLTLLPRPAATAVPGTVPLTAPRVVHRTELLHGSSPGAVAAEVARISRPADAE